MYMRAITILSFALACAGCGSNRTLREPDEFDSSGGMGCGSDENWRTFDDLELTDRVKTDDAQAPFFLAPDHPREAARQRDVHRVPDVRTPDRAE
jgi:hypothetical protein